MQNYRMVGVGNDLEVEFNLLVKQDHPGQFKQECIWMSFESLQREDSTTSLGTLPKAPSLSQL